MSTKNQPATSGPENAAVRTWPREVNTAGVIVDAPEAVRLGDKKRHLRITAAWVVIGGTIGVALGHEYKTTAGTGGGGASAKAGAALTTPAQLEAALAGFLIHSGFASDESAPAALVDVRATLTQVDHEHELFEALGVELETLDAWFDAVALPKPRVLGKGRQMLRYDYSEGEINSFAKELAGTHKAIADIEGRKARANQQFKMELESQHDRVEDFSGRIREGYEMREYPCTTYADTPEKGRKSVVRDDTGETVAVLPMTYADLQQELPLDDKRKPEPTEADDEPATGDDE